MDILRLFFDDRLKQHTPPKLYDDRPNQSPWVIQLVSAPERAMRSPGKLPHSGPPPLSLEGTGFKRTSQHKSMRANSTQRLQEEGNDKIEHVHAPIQVSRSRLPPEVKKLTRWTESETSLISRQTELFRRGTSAPQLSWNVEFGHGDRIGSWRPEIGQRY